MNSIVTDKKLLELRRETRGLLEGAKDDIAIHNLSSDVPLTREMLSVGAQFGALQFMDRLVDKLVAGGIPATAIPSIQRAFEQTRDEIAPQAIESWCFRMPKPS